jgi:TRAP-type C4-dicarboxylate transport system permease small subunit
MTAVLEKVPLRVARLLQLLGFLFMFFFLGIMVVFGTDQMLTNYYQRSPAMQIPMAYPYAALPLGFFIMFLISLEDFVVFWGQRPGKGE